MIGDVVIYRNKEDGEILHVAKLCGIERLSASGEALGDPILKALSKWDSRCGEDIHRLDDVNLVAGTPFDIELWTDRQSEPDPRLRHIQNLPLVTS